VQLAAEQMKLATTSLTALCAALVLGGCATGERLPSGSAGTLGSTHRGVNRGIPVRSPVTVAAREDYARQLAAHDVAAARAWESASRNALRSGLSITPSFRERLRFPAAEPHAVAYRFALREGQTLRIRFDRLDGTGSLFADVFQVVSGEIYRPVESAPAVARQLEFTARFTGEYVLRLQPRIDGGLFDVVVEGNSSLMFPVAGRGVRDIRSLFGDSRDGGRRRHEGVDIFAPRGTPVLAVASGRVVQARNTPVGGRVVWLSDQASDLSYYYAHLDEIHVTEGSWVNPGDVLGTVGNTGNAAGTPPHLHFGAYRPGTIAVDPAPLLAYTESLPIQPLAVDDDVLGRWTRNTDRVRLHTSPDLAAGIVAELPAATPLLVLGGIADWHRVLLPDGTTGFVSARYTAQE
jgi:peptidoglycan LD-endopeptidase LytH